MELRLMDGMPLPLDEIHLWTCRDRSVTDPETLSRLETMLAPHELERRSRFHFQRDRHQYLVTRGILRIVLSMYEPDIAPQDWRFAVNAFGRPTIAEDLDRSLHFNLSHTDGLIVLAFARREVGVDVESFDRAGDLASLVDQYFAPVEIEDMSRLPAMERPRRSVELWTLKEAYLKARGVGLARALDTFNFRFGVDAPHTLDHRSGDDDREAWRFWSACLPDGYCLALASRLSTFDPEPIPRICEFTPPSQTAPVRSLRVWQDAFGHRSSSRFLDTLSEDRPRKVIARR